MATHLNAGDKAPAFSGKDQDGNEVSLSDYKGNKVVLYFYPADDTPACTTQSCNLRDNYQLLQKQGYRIIGVSPDDVESHKKFSLKFNLPFPLIADPQQKISKIYGVWGEKNLYGRKFMGLHRTTFIMNEKGIIEKIFLRPKTKLHTEEILK
ncbi:MAG: thioredoxin-dependent thiol peroxidase [Flavisolibacter sp.]|jgi:peroxiredoxin Q/BCP|nr:thioredoxin-dependent thiol peroxidase [Flavisolibacter sp.]